MNSTLKKSRLSYVFYEIDCLHKFSILNIYKKDYLSIHYKNVDADRTMCFEFFGDLNIFSVQTKHFKQV